VVAAPGRAGGAATSSRLRGKARERVFATVDETARTIAAKEGARAVAWLYLTEDADVELQAVLSARGYLSGVVDAQCYLPITWSSFEEYLMHFKAPRRRTIRMEREALSRLGGRIELGGDELLGPELAGLELHWRRKYGRVASMSNLLHQYAQLRQHLGSMIRVFVAYRGDSPIGFTVFIEHDKAWYARFGGFDYAEKDAFVYFNLLFYAPVEAAISRGIECIDYSLKSYEAKRSRGCLLRNVFLFLRVSPSEAAFARRLLRSTDERQRATFAAIAASHGKAQTPP
jgi:uncharacterized protein